MEKTSVVICLKGNEKENYIIDWCIKNILDKKKHYVRLLTVTEVSIDTSCYLEVAEQFSTTNLIDFETNTKNKSELIIKNAKEKLHKYFGDEFECQSFFLEGEPNSKIVEYSIENKTDLLIVGFTSVGFLEKVFLGSTANYCINNCQCSVLVVKENF